MGAPFLSVATLSSHVGRLVYKDQNEAIHAASQVLYSHYMQLAVQLYMMPI